MTDAPQLALFHFDSLFGKGSIRPNKLDPAYSPYTALFAELQRQGCKVALVYEARREALAKQYLVNLRASEDAHGRLLIDGIQKVDFNAGKSYDRIAHEFGINAEDSLVVMPSPTDAQDALNRGASQAMAVQLSPMVLAKELRAARKGHPDMTPERAKYNDLRAALHLLPA